MGLYNNLAGMDIEIDRERVITKFKRNGLLLNKRCLQIVTEQLKSETNPNKHLDLIIEKVNEMIIIGQQQFNQKNLKIAIELLSHQSETGKTFDTYNKLMDNLNKWTTFYLSPYERRQRFFVEKPEPLLFSFDPDVYLQTNLKRFKQIKEHIQLKAQPNEHLFLGVVYESYSIDKTRVMLQNQANEIELVFPPGFETDVFLIPGCTYIARGIFKTRDLQLNVRIIELPAPITASRDSLCQDKLKLVCDNILMSKNRLNFTCQEFKPYEIIYNQEENRGKAVLIFGNVLLTKTEISAISKIGQQLGYGLECMILLIAPGNHEKLDLQRELSMCPVYLVPHIDSEGPRILPKIPVLKHNYNVRVTSNPARFSIHGKECVFLNYPLVQNLCEKSLIQNKTSHMNSDDIVQRISNMLFSQNNVSVCHKIYWRQSQYFRVNSDNNIFVFDKACSHKVHTQKEASFTSVGNFQRDRDFITYLPALKKIQMCSQQQ